MVFGTCIRSTNQQSAAARCGHEKAEASDNPGFERNGTASGDNESKKNEPFFSPGTLAAAAEAMKSRRFGAAAAEEESLDLGIGLGTLGCGNRNPDGNVRVNQDCTYRRQAEEKIVYSVADPDNLVAGANDSRVGFNQCSIAFSLDNGRHWGDMLPPFRQKVNNPDGELPTASDPNRHTILGGPGTFHTYDFGSDPAPAFDSSGRAFFTCVALDVFDNAAMVYVAQSPKGAQGSYFRNIDVFSRMFIVAEDNSLGVSHDKPLITADSFPNSPYRDNVYATWTVFSFDPRCVSVDNPGGFCSSPIFGSCRRTTA